MKLEDFRLICIKEGEDWCVHLADEKFSGMLAQVDNLEEAPKKIAEMFEAMLREGFKKNIHILKES